MPIASRGGVLSRRILDLTADRISAHPYYSLTCRLTIPHSVRSHDEFNNLLLLSASSRTPLLTFWTASWCPSCRVVMPIVREAIESGVGEQQGGVGFAEVEFDAPGMGDLGIRYFVPAQRRFRRCGAGANEGSRSTRCHHFSALRGKKHN